MLQKATIIDKGPPEPERPEADASEEAKRRYELQVREHKAWHKLNTEPVELNMEAVDAKEAIERDPERYEMKLVVPHQVNVSIEDRVTRLEQRVEVLENPNAAAAERPAEDQSLQLAEDQPPHQPADEPPADEPHGETLTERRDRLVPRTLPQSTTPPRPENQQPVDWRDSYPPPQPPPPPSPPTTPPPTRGRPRSPVDTGS